MGYGSTYEKDLFLEVKQGLFINESITQNQP